MFKGTGTALITPFNEDYNVDYNDLKKIINFQIGGGVDAIILLGTTGESPVISVEERRKIIETGIQTAAGKTKIIAGTGTNDTKKVVEFNKIAEEYKADGLLIVNPYYNKGTQESLVEHYKYISERTTLPIILYNVPSRTAMNLLPETVVKIHNECKNVVAVKEASGNISQIAHLFSIKPDSLSVLSGNDDQALPIMALGGDGVVSVFSNPYPKEMKQITDAILNNDFENAQRLNNKYLRMMNLLFVETSPSPVKFVMYQMGLSKNLLRLPLAPVNKKSEQLLIDEMKKL
ncbi:MAG: 4-hydroxy-tetrahydrodipicolinate synthase [Ignavibacteria bacterium]|nr:4-hydroxy-tetrahydrodipicolinate synthase [Ignavibacteria bacterium]